MVPFLHDRLARTAKLLDSSNAALRAHQQGAPDATDRIAECLDAMATTYQALGRDVGANEVLTLRAQLVAAQRGYAPGATTKALTDRRGLERAIGLAALSTAAERLRTDIDRDRTTLDTGRDQLRVLVLHGLRLGIIAAKAAGASLDPEATWKAMLHEPETRLLAQQIAMQLSIPDIHLLLLELISLAAVS
jgi:hypothetical protein